MFPLQEAQLEVFAVRTAEGKLQLQGWRTTPAMQPLTSGSRTPRCRIGSHARSEFFYFDIVFDS